MLQEQFPILNQKVNGKPLVYLDNAATSQKPLRVINSMNDYYKETNSNIHRGAHYLAEKATIAYEDSRTFIAEYLNAKETEINFVRGTTEGINLIAYTFGEQNIQEGDEIIVSHLEHHSNIVPWQMLCERKKATLKVIPVLENGVLDMDYYEKLLSNKTKLVAVNYVSNSLGTINPVQEIIEKAHQVGAKVLIDGAQSVPHIKVDLKKLDCDFFTFSGHKVYGPTGIGILYGKEAILESIPPFHGGGEMIKTVSFDGTTYNNLPYKFEAGTPNICGGIALGEALKFIDDIGIESIAAHEQELLEYGTQKMQNIDGVKIYGTAPQKASVISFLIDGIHPYDLGVLLDKQGIAIRTGHHCCQPLMHHWGIEGTCRASFAVYNTKEEIDIFAKAVEKAVMILA